MSARAPQFYMHFAYGRHSFACNTSLKCMAADLYRLVESKGVDQELIDAFLRRYMHPSVNGRHFTWSVQETLACCRGTPYPLRTALRGDAVTTITQQSLARRGTPMIVCRVNEEPTAYVASN